MSRPQLSEAIVRQFASADSYERGRKYYRDGSVVSLVQRGDTLLAEVEGSDYFPYRVHVAWDEGGITGAECSCPYDWGGWCKHLVAALLTYLHEPEAVTERPPIEEQVAQLGVEQLRSLLLTLARDPSVADLIEKQIALAQAAPDVGQKSKAETRRTPVDPEPIRHQVHDIMRSVDYRRRSQSSWDVGDVVGQVRGLLAQVHDALTVGDTENALVLLEAITEEYWQNWEYIDDDGMASDFFYTLGTLWTELMFAAELTPAQRKLWAKKLERWQTKLGDYGIDDVFGAAEVAANTGWQDRVLQAILRGEPVAPGDEPEYWYLEELTAAQLRVLERQERYEEYLRLAQARGAVEPYLLMLARLGRSEEAVTRALAMLATPSQALTLAKTLRERGELDAAIRVAEHGLSLEDAETPFYMRSKAPLGNWLSEVAEGTGNRPLARRATRIAFMEQPTLAGYLRLQELAGEEWEALQQELLQELRGRISVGTPPAVEIFLHEGLLDDAIAAVEHTYYNHALLEQVMDAAMTYRPDWVIAAAKKQAASIIEPGKAQHYDAAVQWMRKARDAYRAAGREDAWQDYLADIRARHGRKYKLMGLLEGL